MTYRGCTRNSAYEEASRVYLDGCNNNVLPFIDVVVLDGNMNIINIHSKPVQISHDN